MREEIESEARVLLRAITMVQVGGDGGLAPDGAVDAVKHV